MQMREIEYEVYLVLDVTYTREDEDGSEEISERIKTHSRFPLISTFPLQQINDEYTIQDIWEQNEEAIKAYVYDFLAGRGYPEKVEIFDVSNW